MSKPATSRPKRATRRKRLPSLPPMGRFRVDGQSVLVVLVLSFIILPFAQETAAGLFFESVMMTLLLAAGVLAVGGTRRTLIIATALGFPAVVAKWLNHSSPDLAPASLFLVFAVLTMGYVIFQFLRYIMRARKVDSHVLCTGIAAFLLTALLWAFVYQLIDRQVPGSFSYSTVSQSDGKMRGLTSLYFSLVTLCTVGFGDIVPVSNIARTFTMLEGAVGVFFVAVLISRLVSLYSIERLEQSEILDQTGKPPSV